MIRKESPIWPERGALERPDISPETLEAAIRRGRQLRSAHAASLLAGAVAAIGNGLRRVLGGLRSAPGYLRQAG